MEEIPAQLLDREESLYSEGTSTFRDAVERVQQGRRSYSDKYGSRNSENTVSKSISTPDGYVKPSKGFGANFVAPSVKKTTNLVQRTPNKIIINKSPINKQREEEKLKAFFEDNIMKRKLEERKQKEAQLAEEKMREEELKNTATQYFFNVGERVFHDKLGVGHIADVIQIGDSTMYTIDFGKFGKKAMDAAYAHLKKF